MCSSQSPQAFKKVLVGICGRAGSGKSTFCKMLADAAEENLLRCLLLDADKIARRLYDRLDVRARIGSAFGKDAYDPSGKLNRNRLAEIVFADSEKLEHLNSIIHPLLVEELERRIDTFYGNLVIIDAALLLDWSLADQCDLLIAVIAREDISIERLAEKGINDTKATAILANQRSVEDFSNQCRVIVENNEGLATLRCSAKNVFEINILPLLTS